MTILQTVTECIKAMQQSGDGADLIEIVVDKKTRDRLAFEMMQNDRQVSNPKFDADHFRGKIEIFGVTISERRP